MSPHRLNLLPKTIFAIAAICIVASGCREEDPVRTVANQGSLPTMVTTDVDTYVSDSGFIKYHAQTDIWEMYDETTDPYWRFPRPLLIDILAPNMKPDAHIECDSALYLTAKQLFNFQGDVVAVNVMRDTFLTPQLWWDQRIKEFYTDSFIHIVKSDRILEGYGFRSNERMTKYSIRKPTAIIPMSTLRNNDANGGNAGQRVRNDSAGTSGGADSYGPAPVPASQRNRNALQAQPGASTGTANPGAPTAQGLRR